MNRDEQGGAGRKFDVLSKHSLLFEWPQSLFAATKIYILIFNLADSFISLMGSLKEWNISIIYFEFEMWSSSFMWILHLIFNSEA